MEGMLRGRADGRTIDATRPVRSGRRRGRALPATFAAVLLLAGACSGDDDETAGTDGEVSGTADTSVDASSGTTGPAVAVDPASIEAEPSAGCEAGSASTPADDGAQVDVAGADGADRWYLQHLPADYDGSTPVPVVVDMHGYSEGAQVHGMHTLLHELGETEGFVTIYPNGQGPVPRWDATPGSSDSVWFGELLDELEATLCLDTNRVYATGLSNGAFMTSTVVCDHADRIAAAAPVAGIQATDDCEPSRPVPFVAFHGTDDTFVPFEGGLGEGAANLPSPDGEGGTLGDEIEEAGEAGEGGEGGEAVADRASVPDATAAWAERNGCEPEPTEESIFDDVTLISYDCPVGGAAVLFRVEGGGHTWPGAEFLAEATTVVGTTTFSIDANEVIWEFFRAHPLGIAG